MIKKLLNKHQHAILAIDIVIFTIIEQQLYVLLQVPTNKDYKGMWACPGGLVELEEDLDIAAKRHMKATLGNISTFNEQLYTFGKASRDKSGHIVSTGYIALIAEEKAHSKTISENENLQWFPVKKLPKMAYDHKLMVSKALERLQNKLCYSTVVYALLPDHFTLSELQDVYEIVLEKDLDKRNFRKKLLALHILRKIGKKRKGEANRPAELYGFNKKTCEVANIM